MGISGSDNGLKPIAADHVHNILKTEEIRVTENTLNQENNENLEPDKEKVTLSSYGLLALAAIPLLVLDILTKEWVRANLDFGDFWSPLGWLRPYARVIHWRNSGAAFGMFQDGNLIFTALAVIVVGVIIYYYPQIPKEERALRIALGMQFAGAVGNLIDRLRFSHVTDIFSVGTFPVFNVADSSIFVGTGILLIAVWVAERREKKQRDADRMIENEEVNELGEAEEALSGE